VILMKFSFFLPRKFLNNIKKLTTLA